MQSTETHEHAVCAVLGTYQGRPTLKSPEVALLALRLTQWLKSLIWIDPLVDDPGLNPAHLPTGLRKVLIAKNTFDRNLGLDC